MFCSVDIKGLKGIVHLLYVSTFKGTIYINNFGVEKQNLENWAKHNLILNIFYLCINY